MNNIQGSARIIRPPDPWSVNHRKKFSQKLLGLTISLDLSLADHIAKLVPKASQRKPCRLASQHHIYLSMESKALNIIGNFANETQSQCLLLANRRQE